MANNQNLKSYKPGQSGNPKGKPKGSRNRSTIAKEMLEVMMNAKSLDGEDSKMTAEEAMTAKMILKALSDGDVSAYKALMDSAYGTPKQTIEQNNTQQKPKKVRFTDGGE